MVQYLSLPHVVFLALAALAGWVLAWRSHWVRSNETFREIFLWTGGFIIYAIADYVILMR